MIGWLVLGVAVVLLGLAWRLRRQTGLPWKAIVYSDASWQRNERPLIAPEWGLVGKPDYLLLVGKGVIPVEVKPGRRVRTPYESDLMQLAAYCLLVEATTGRRPPYGILRYAEQSFRLEFTHEVRRRLIEIVDAMRHDRGESNVPRSHEQVARCRGCGFIDMCVESLV